MPAVAAPGGVSGVKEGGWLSTVNANFKSTAYSDTTSIVARVDRRFCDRVDVLSRDQIVLVGIGGRGGPEAVVAAAETDGDAARLR